VRELRERIQREMEERKKMMAKLLEEQMTPEEMQKKEKYIRRMKAQSQEVEKKGRDAGVTGARAEVNHVKDRHWLPKLKGSCPFCARPAEGIEGEHDFVPEYAILAERHCLQCNEDYCAECFVEHHPRSELSKRFHKFQVIKDAHEKVSFLNPICAGFACTKVSNALNGA
jgi:hypothetical protein